ncbi:TPA: hypothetical protein I9080_002762 [Clostridium perfringens]|uniref:Uncharacterized protein n=1 Tax=Clostridium perfringens TaxID=1502 RepID=A0A8H9QZ47_CLOPF|nr:hypothetical protein [Clostridium perfringens]
MIQGINKDHITGALVGVGICAAGYYVYKKNQAKVDDFLRKQGINVSNDLVRDYASMSLEELMETKETLEDLIAERELAITSSAKDEEELITE